MGQIAHLKMTCPHCGKWTSVYVEETGAPSAEVNCEYCKKVFTFGAGMMYSPVGYVSEIPAADADDNKQRHGCLTALLIFTFIVSLLLAIVSIMFLNDGDGEDYGLSHEGLVLNVISCIMCVVASILIWNWKKIGFWIYVASIPLDVIAFLYDQDYTNAFWSIIPIGVLYGILHLTGKDGRTGWENMR